MRNSSPIVVSALLICAFAFSGFNDFQNCEPLTRPQIRQMLVQMAYEVKDIVTDPGKEKYSIVITREGLDVPIGIELSGNTKYIWLTVNLGDFKPDNSTRNIELLKQNGKIQPQQFDVTESGRLMLGLPMENRGVSNVMLREKLEAFAGNVGKTKTVCQ